MNIPRRIPRRYVAVWCVLAVLFSVALFAPGAASWWFSLATLAWFGAWEAAGIASARKGDTLSESVWALLDVQAHKPVNRALFPLVMGLFAAAACLFAGVVEGAGEQWMSNVPRTIAACLVGAGTLGFLVRHFRRGDSR